MEPSTSSTNQRQVFLPSANDEAPLQTNHLMRKILDTPEMEQETIQGFDSSGRFFTIHQVSTGEFDCNRLGVYQFSDGHQLNGKLIELQMENGSYVRCKSLYDPVSTRWFYVDLTMRGIGVYDQSLIIHTGTVKQLFDDELDSSSNNKIAIKTGDLEDAKLQIPYGRRFSGIMNARLQKTAEGGGFLLVLLVRTGKTSFNVDMVKLEPGGELSHLKQVVVSNGTLEFSWHWHFDNKVDVFVDEKLELIHVFHYKKRLFFAYDFSGDELYWRPIADGEHEGCKISEIVKYSNDLFCVLFAASNNLKSVLHFLKINKIEMIVVKAISVTYPDGFVLTSLDYHGNNGKHFLYALARARDLQKAVIYSYDIDSGEEKVLHEFDGKSSGEIKLNWNGSEFALINKGKYYLQIGKLSCVI